MTFINKKHIFNSHLMPFIAFLILISNIYCSSIDKTRTPKIDNWVNDTANILSENDYKRLTNKLEQYHTETHHQIVILTIPTLSGETIEDFSLRVTNANGIGYKGYDNGILVTLAMKEKRVRIELGFGMEKYISDAEAQSILDDEMIPSFKEGDFTTGLENGLNRLMEKARDFAISDDEFNNRNK